MGEINTLTNCWLAKPFEDMCQRMNAAMLIGKQLCATILTLPQMSLFSWSSPKNNKLNNSRIFLNPKPSIYGPMGMNSSQIVHCWNVFHFYISLMGTIVWWFYLRGLFLEHLQTPIMTVPRRGTIAGEWDTYCQRLYILNYTHVGDNDDDEEAFVVWAKCKISEMIALVQWRDIVTCKGLQ